MPSMPAPDASLVVVPARPDQLAVVVDILEEAAQWLAGRGIDQWPPGTFRHAPSAERIGQRIAGGEVYLALRHGQPVGTLTLQPSDPLIWGDVPADALYLHRLAIRRAAGGQGIGRWLLQWAEDTAAAAGKSYLRLDCMTAMRNDWTDEPFSLRTPCRRRPPPVSFVGPRRSWPA